MMMPSTNPSPGFPLPEVLQHYAQAGKSGVVEVKGPDGMGVVSLVSGMVVHSQTPHQVGEEAFFELLGWSKAPYEWNEGASLSAVTMTGNVEDLLLRHIMRDGKSPTPKISGPVPQPHLSTETREIGKPGNGKMLLKITSSECDPITFQLDAPRVQAGREPDNDLCIPDTSVSRRHALLICAPGSIIVRDLGSKNGTYVNGKQITQGAIKVGETLTLGEAVCRLEDA